MSGLLEVDELHVWFDLGDAGELHAVQGVSLALELIPNHLATAEPLGLKP